MATFWWVSSTLLLCYKHGSSRAAAAPVELSGVLGESVTFPVGIPAEQFRTAAWTVNTSNSIAAVGAGNPPAVWVMDVSYEGRLSIAAQNSLQLTGLRLQDSGTYTAKIITTTGATIHKRFLLRVYKRVPKPTIVCDLVTCVNGTCSYNLTCTAQGGGENVTYSWTHPAGGAVESTGPILCISPRPSAAHLNVTCTAQNPVSSSSATASAELLCAASPLPQRHVGGIVGIMVPLAFVFVIILYCCYRTWKTKRGMQKHALQDAGNTGADVENSTIYAQVSNPPLVSTRKGAQNGDPETKEETAKTIYSTVHLPNQVSQETDDEKLRKEGRGSMEPGEKTVYSTVNQPTETETCKPTKASDSLVTPGKREYNEII
ncbi:SLAM family member 5-like [Carettochelys insculpta]|uniref:SLAM family member 5-like n=1 Tax=Carettochelys insculpta TaxID=44489 RepID=UPI003EC0B845